MPTEKPRVSITLDADDIAVLDRYSTASGTPRATMIAGLVRAAVPELAKAAELIELANAAPRRVVQGMVDDLANATADAMGYLMPFHSDYQRIMGELDTLLGQKSGGDGARVAGDDHSPAAGRRVRKRPQDPRLLTGGSK
jgi:hypothetical protein